MASFLVDTNILVYALDASEPAKRDRAIEVLARLSQNGRGALSIQVLNEFYINARRKGTALPELEGAIIDFIRTWEVLEPTTVSVEEAMRAVDLYKFSYWDALVWAAARLNAVPNILTEDIPSSAFIEGVRYLNPFAPGFDMEVLG